MKKIEFLIFGKNPSILEILIRLVNANEEWHAEGFTDKEFAKEYCANQVLDIVLLSSGIEEECEEEMRFFFNTNQPNIEIIQHYGGGSGLLKCEILEALEQKRKRKIAESQV
ncbi:hypothetical protein [Flavobacterium aquatile]|uniref:Uncharacterized protein n=1 Tax=Flavobacterium aquatile LMG 4008 = ATCC 11947 TaxID=1453498 RepID=A0A095SRJ3_9FLAO|nr:hypothetical protein [Flavobacterium aquatile]KGD66979.1 hypothetical protein LG45_16325 [Flavobacterium aquatile LMG 4008 = ATCC 11947]OXA68074.1 hypothetical protein B0A61_06295 [Flavobacterium aquatile LMG 4008 = ATCC 11947]